MVKDTGLVNDIGKVDIEQHQKLSWKCSKEAQRTDVIQHAHFFPFLFKILPIP